jgi:hypothetical protein
LNTVDGPSLLVPIPEVRHLLGGIGGTGCRNRVRRVTGTPAGLKISALASADRSWVSATSVIPEKSASAVDITAFAVGRSAAPGLIAEASRDSLTYRTW